MSHEHLWKRHPVTDFTVTYECECGTRHRMQWCTLIPSVGEVDAKIMKAYGGIVHGDAHQSWDFTLSRRMLQMAGLGLNLYPEGLDFRPTCPVCGVPMDKPELHQKFHDGLRELARRIEAPDSTPEQYDQAIAGQWDRERPGWRDGVA